MAQTRWQQWGREHREARRTLENVPKWESPFSAGVAFVKASIDPDGTVVFLQGQEGINHPRGIQRVEIGSEACLSLAQFLVDFYSPDPKPVIILDAADNETPIPATEPVEPRDGPDDIPY